METEVYSMIVVDFLEMILFMLLIRESFLDKKKREDICIHIADSFCCTLETNTTM